MKADFQYNLGDRVRDRVTNYKGIVTARIEHLNGCRQYSVQAGLGEDGKMLDGYNIDEAQLEFVDKGLNEKPVPRTPTGGPMTKLTPNRI